MAEYSKLGFVLLNGIPVGQASQSRFRLTSNDKPVRTLRGGLVGFSDGPHECSVDFRNAIPIEGFENEYNAITLAHRTVRVGFRIANKQYECEGRFMDTDTETDVDAANTINITFMGRVLTETSL